MIIGVLLSFWQINVLFTFTYTCNESRMVNYRALFFIFGMPFIYTVPVFTISCAICNASAFHTSLRGKLKTKCHQGASSFALSKQWSFLLMIRLYKICWTVWIVLSFLSFSGKKVWLCWQIAFRKISDLRFACNLWMTLEVLLYLFSNSVILFY